MSITGNIKDKDYYLEYVSQLTSKIFNIKFNVRIEKSRNAIVIFKDSKAIHSFLKHYFELPSNKNHVVIPKIIMQASEEIKTTFLRGFFDADGCFVVKYKPNPYPVVQAASKSSQLIKEVAEVLAELEIPSCTFKETSFYKKRNKTYITHEIFINGRKRVKKFMNKIGFSNKNKIEKYRIFIENECYKCKKRAATPCKSKASKTIAKIF